MPLPLRLTRQRFLLLCLLLTVVVVTVPPLRRTAYAAGAWLHHRLQGKKTVAQRLAQYGPAARARLAPYFKRGGVTYPPSRVTLVGLKDQRHLEVYARSQGGWRFIRSYDIVAASGKPGPKLREGDMQVPEGIYQIDSLNPNSLFHLAIRLDYPNEFDRARAAEEGRDDLGGDIMIHGSNGSVGCLAMGDVTAEELFVLAADVGIQKVSIILAPTDFRRQRSSVDPRLPPWTRDLYRGIDRELRRLPAHGPPKGRRVFGKTGYATVRQSAHASDVCLTRGQYLARQRT